MSVVLRRRLTRTAVFAVIALALVGPLPSRAQGVAFSGLVRDSLGNVLEDVEVLIVNRTPSPLPIAVARSDVRGRFQVVDLPADTYRIAALKDGYLTFVTQVDTQLQRWVDVILHPIPTLESDLPQPLPQSSSWVYRLPRRFLFEETEARPTPATDATVRPRSGPLFDLVQMRVDQLFALRGSLLLEDDSSYPEVRGSETRVQIASALGTRGNLQLQGFRRSYDGAAELARAKDEDAALSVAFSYDTGTDARLDLGAFYGERDLDIERLPPTLSAVTQSSTHAQRYWGYDVKWSTQLGASSSLAVKLDYGDATLTIPDKLALVEAQAGPELSARSVGAVGSYDTVPAADHQLELRFGAQLLESPEATLRPHVGEVPAAFDGVEGLSVGVNARDRWSVGGPFSVLYGVGYQRRSTAAGPSVIVPQIGGAWSVEDLALQVLVTYHDVADGVADAPHRPFGEGLGYEARLEAPILDGLRLAATTHYSPFQLDLLHDTPSAARAREARLFVTDGQAAVRENRVKLVHESDQAQTFLELARGSVDGNVATIAPVAGPLLVLSRGTLSYDSGRLGLRIVPSGTDLILEYQKAVQIPVGETAPSSDSRQRSLELRIAQDVLNLHSIGNWRVLMALSTASIETEAWDERMPYDDPELLNSLNHQVRAGLSVVF